jgi:hypothetical protein
MLLTSACPTKPSKRSVMKHCTTGNICDRNPPGDMGAAADRF